MATPNEAKKVGTADVLLPADLHDYKSYEPVLAGSKTNRRTLVEVPPQGGANVSANHSQNGPHKFTIGGTLKLGKTLLNGIYQFGYDRAGSLTDAASYSAIDNSTWNTIQNSGWTVWDLTLKSNGQTIETNAEPELTHFLKWAATPSSSDDSLLIEGTVKETSTSPYLTSTTYSNQPTKYALTESAMAMGYLILDTPAGNNTAGTGYSTIVLNCANAMLIASAVPAAGVALIEGLLYIIARGANDSGAGSTATLTVATPVGSGLAAGDKIGYVDATAAKDLRVHTIAAPSAGMQTVTLKVANAGAVTNAVTLFRSSAIIDNTSYSKSLEKRAGKTNVTDGKFPMILPIELGLFKALDESQVVLHRGLELEVKKRQNADCTMSVNDSSNTYQIEAQDIRLLVEESVPTTAGAAMLQEFEASKVSQNVPFRTFTYDTFSIASGSASYQHMHPCGARPKRVYLFHRVDGAADRMLFHHMYMTSLRVRYGTTDYMYVAVDNWDTDEQAYPLYIQFVRSLGAQYQDGYFGNLTFEDWKKKYCVIGLDMSASVAGMDLDADPANLIIDWRFPTSAKTAGGALADSSDTITHVVVALEFERVAVIDAQGKVSLEYQPA